MTKPTETAASAADDFNQTKGFRKQVTLAGIREHQAAFQSFADANGGNRVDVGRPDHDQPVAGSQHVAKCRLRRVESSITGTVTAVA